MKLIKLADREDWHTVREYVKDDLASDTDDEKSITRAIKAASAKKGKYLTQKLKRPLDKRESLKSKFHRKPRSQIVCYSCGNQGHTAAQCYRKNKKAD